MLLIFLIFFRSSPGFCQNINFDPTISEERMTIEGVARKGFSTRFDHPANMVEKSWWRYSRNFGRPLNMKSYYQVTIPSSENSGTVDIVLYSKALSSKSGSKFFLTIQDDHVPADRKPIYMDQVELILQDFKKHFYISLLEEELEAAEKRAKKLSKAVDKGEKDMKALMQEEQKLDALREELKAIYLTL